MSSAAVKVRRRESVTDGRVDGAFSLEHFERWSRRLILDNGKPFVMEGFQRAWLEDLFSGRRENWLILPEGSGKTTLISAVALYGLRFSEDAVIPVAASSRDQARIMYRQAKGFLRRSKLDDAPLWFDAFDGYRRIDLRGPGDTKRGEVLGSIEIYAADAGTADGVIPFPFAILDELHRHRTLDLYETWKGKLEKRDAQILTISTAGEAGSPFEETRERIRQETSMVDARPGFTRCVSDEIVFHEHALEEGADPADMEAVKRCNPLASLTVEKLVAKHASPTMTPQHWSRFVCNLSTRSTAAAITELEWHNAATAEPLPVFDDWWLGIDVGWKWDTTAIVPLAWLANDHRRFAPATIIEPPRDGSSTNPAVIRRAVEEITGRLRVSTVVMDMHRAEELAAWLSDDLGLTVVDRSQSSKSASEDFERFMEALRQGWIRHSGDAGLRAHALNAVARLLPGGGARFERPSQTRIGGNQDARVIDALDAASFVHSVRCEWKPVVRYRSAGF